MSRHLTTAELLQKVMDATARKTGRPAPSPEGVKNAIAARTAKVEEPVTKGPRRIIVRR
jgi:hypothetical protein